MFNSIFTIALTLFFVIDAFGNIPLFLTFLKRVDKKRMCFVAARELFFALIIMILFHYVGQALLNLLDIQTNTVRIAGGTILFLIAIRLIFSHEEDRSKGWGSGAPFIVPLATPIIAGPSVLAVIMIYAQQEPSDLIVLSAIFFAWLVSSVIYFFAMPIHRLIGDTVLLACQRLMGLIVALIAVEMFLQGMKDLILTGKV